MKIKRDEFIKLTMVYDGDERVLDIRVWKRTQTGGMPTSKSIIVEKKFIVPLIIGLQKLHREESEIAANATGSKRG